MLLTLDVGNSQIFAGVFENEKLKLTFRKNSKQSSSSDEIGTFLRAALRENGFNPEKIKQISVCSVVPEVVYSLRGACQKYFNITPFFLQAGAKTGLQIKYRNPIEVGADRIANSIAAIKKFPNENLIIIDLGTATTFCALTKNREYLGGVIIAGIRISMESLELKTAKLPSVEITHMSEALGRGTIESIQSGLYFGHLGQIREISRKLAEECFPNEKFQVIGTGGFAQLYEKEKIFSVIITDLVLQGLLQAWKLNAATLIEDKHVDRDA